MGLYANSLIKKDSFDQSNNYKNITTHYNIYISEKVITNYYGQDTTGTFEKETSNYYYDGKIDKAQSIFSWLSTSSVFDAEDSIRYAVVLSAAGFQNHWYEEACGAL